ncbi:3D domain-containing protein [candidate division WWE3 bacterium]|nr:3D domain-containing protein [candidate division WWE3 bacterium]
MTYKVTFWIDDEIDRQLIKTGVEEPVEEKIAKGTKIVWREYKTSDVGGVWYWQKIKVWATKYDGNCYGCSGRTFSGTSVVKGVCATDPKTIKLGTNFYVDGYGICRAEDIGGAIKGNKIDLGFEDASKGNWGAAWTYVYLLSNSPEGDRK